MSGAVKRCGSSPVCVSERRLNTETRGKLPRVRQHLVGALDARSPVTLRKKDRGAYAQVSAVMACKGSARTVVGMRSELVILRPAGVCAEACLLDGTRVTLGRICVHRRCFEHSAGCGFGRAECQHGGAADDRDVRQVGNAAGRRRRACRPVQTRSRHMRRYSVWSRAPAVDRPARRRNHCQRLMITAYPVHRPGREALVPVP